MAHAPAAFPSASAGLDDPILKMTGVSKRFPGVLALENVHLEVGPSEIHALLGENGAGKSTLLKILSGAQAPMPGISSCSASRPLLRRRTTRSGLASSRSIRSSRLLPT